MSSAVRGAGLDSRQEEEVAERGAGRGVGRKRGGAGRKTRSNEGSGRLERAEEGLAMGQGEEEKTDPRMAAARTIAFDKQMRKPMSSGEFSVQSQQPSETRS